MTKEDYFWEWILPIAATVIFILVLLIGCVAQQKPIETTPVSGDILETARTVYKTNWLAMPFIVGVALGVVLLIKGKVLDGLAIAGGSGAGLYALASYQAFATHRYAPWIAAVVILVLGFSLIAYLLYSYHVDKRAISELANGGERHKSTEKLIAKAKKKLKGKSK